MNTYAPPLTAEEIAENRRRLEQIQRERGTNAIDAIARLSAALQHYEVGIALTEREQYGAYAGGQWIAEAEDLVTLAPLVYRWTRSAAAQEFERPEAAARRQAMNDSIARSARRRSGGYQSRD